MSIRSVGLRMTSSLQMQTLHFPCFSARVICRMKLSELPNSHLHLAITSLLDDPTSLRGCTVRSSNCRALSPIPPHTHQPQQITNRLCLPYLHLFILPSKRSWVPTYRRAPSPPPGYGQRRSPSPLLVGTGGTDSPRDGRHLELNQRPPATRTDGLPPAPPGPQFFY